MTDATKIVIASGLVNLPFMILAVISLTYGKPAEEKIFDSVSKYALAYEEAVDKEKYLETIYDDIKDIDEVVLPHDLKVFVIKVKVSQFGKLD
jgi:hypothetical protein